MIKMKKLFSALLSCVMITLTPGIISSAQENAIDIVYNKNSSCYREVKGLFFDDVSSKCASGRTTRYSYSKDAEIIYSPTVSEDGNYAVYYWNTGSKDNRNQQDFFITSDDGEANVKLNLKGDKGWKYLGVYSFSQNGPVEIKLTRDLYGGAIRSGSLRIIKTDKPTHIAYSQEPVTTAVRDYPDGDGILITNRIMKSNHTYSQSANFSVVALVNAEGRAMRYTDIAGAIMSYTPTITEAGEYHVMYWMFKESASQTTEAFPINIYHEKGVEELTINGLEHNGWVYLGKYSFKEGNYGGLETVNPEGARMYSGGAYFVSVNDENFDPSLYASIDSPGSKKGATANEVGDYLIYTGSQGYTETGILSGNNNDCFNLDCDKRYSRKFDGAKYPNNTMMYTADINQKGSYEIFYYIIEDPDNASEQKVIINTSDGVVEKTIDCSNQSGWVSLGEYRFCSKINATVTTPAAASGYTRSGGVKFVNKYRCLDNN